MKQIEAMNIAGEEFFFFLARQWPKKWTFVNNKTPYLVFVILLHLCIVVRSSLESTRSHNYRQVLHYMCHGNKGWDCNDLIHLKKKWKTFYMFSKTATFTIRALLKLLYFSLTISHYHSQLLRILPTPRMFRWGCVSTRKVLYCFYKIFLKHNSTNEGKCCLFEVVYLILDQKRFSWYALILPTR